ncbi:unnamed protein product [Toxocara canis]|uniref:Prolyl-tRNA synthetase n=1 Tax=Toxocara canis TaxID=6265 RepID=A0A183TWL8_TOXCA|nr:unnamed protein product [Toxocara canis]
MCHLIYSYLHIGHAKAALLNQYYQQTFEGQLIMRFDDTNPAKENAHFEEVIKEDLKLLEVMPDRWSHTSDHFDTILELCERLLKEGKAFVDDTDTETMRKEREERQESRNRNNPVATNLALWDEMKRGTEKGQRCCVRIKIDMNSNNGAMRDPTIYRCKNEPHVRTGDKYKVYPTYDFACPIVDSLEGVTHALRTTEYTDRDEQYYLICDMLGLRKPHIWSYARLNMTNTVMSKRKLTWFVDEHHVDGWSDPRLPTVRGVMRRGMTVEGLKQFIIAQGGSRSVVTMEWDKIWSFNKKVIDPVAPRYTALSTDESLVPVVVQGQMSAESKQVSLHPKRTDIGEKSIWYSGKVFVEEVDAREMKPGDTVTFINWGNMSIVDVRKDASGRVVEVKANLDLDNKDYKKTLKVTWIAEAPLGALIPVVEIQYDHIISKPIIGKDEDWKQYINYDSAHFKEMRGEPALKNVHKGDIIQIQRKGFYICDNAYCSKSGFSGAEMPLVLIAIPDGSKQARDGGIVRGNTVTHLEVSTKGSSTKEATVAAGANANALEAEIEKQGNLVRQLKAKDPKSVSYRSHSCAESKVAIAKLLELKKQYKEMTGSDYKPKPVTSYTQVTACSTQLATSPTVRSETASADALSTQLITSPTASSELLSASGADELCGQIEEQGKLVRSLKAANPKGEETKTAIAKLLHLKATYRNITGSDYKPKPSGVQVNPSLTTPIAATSSAGAWAAPTELDTSPTASVETVSAWAASTQLATSPTASTETAGAWAASSQFATSPNASTVTVDAWAGPTQLATSSAAEVLVTSARPAQLATLSAASAAEAASAWKASAQLTTAPTAETGCVAIEQHLKPVFCLIIQRFLSVSSLSNESETTQIVSEHDEVDTLRRQITVQGNLIRALKAVEAKDEALKAALTKLLEMRNKFRELSGFDYVPGMKLPLKQQKLKNVENRSDIEHLYDEIEDQECIVRSLQTSDPRGEALNDATAKLHALKEEFRVKTGCEFKSECGDEPEANGTEAAGERIAMQIQEQGDLVRALKARDAKSKESVEAIAKLLELKKAYKEATGKDYVSVQTGSGKKSNKGKEKPMTGLGKPEVKKAKTEPNVAALQSSDAKKQTKLGVETRKEDNYSDWYSQVITKADMIEYYDVSGCYVLRPWSFSIWETIKKWFGKEIKKLGVRNCYFPMFVSQSALEKEQTHIADFAPEVAWVTRAGSSEMAEPIAIRPTSETVMYPSYAKWIKSHRDLPLRLNQWCNVVRWEFKHPTPFLRSREFLWQEGHSAFQTAEEAQKEVFQILDLYAKVYTDLLAIPVVKGRKSEKEKFAGGDFTTTVEAYVPVNGRAIQGATSHHLGQNFSKMFDISFEDPVTGAKAYVYQNSWGITTRTIGAMVMVHGDDSGLVLPPKVAPVQIIVVPVGITAQTSEEQRKDLVNKTNEITLMLLNDAEIRAESDLRDNYSPGWKFNYWEQKGVPVRMEVGPRDIANNQVTCVIRHSGEKIAVPMPDLITKSKQMLEDIHHKMFEKAREARDYHRKLTCDWNEFNSLLDKKFVLISPFCGGIECEEAIKKESTREESSSDINAAAMGAKTLCIPLEQVKCFFFSHSFFFFFVVARSENGKRISEIFKFETKVDLCAVELQ